MNEYTAADFARARVAIKGERESARRTYPGDGLPWLSRNGGRWSDHELAELGWVPVQEGRPLTPEAITDEMVERAAHCLAMQQMPATYSLEPDGTADKFYGDARDVLHAALIEPPTRPEGAEEIEAILAELPDTDLPITDAGRADLLAERGVRVTGSES